MMNENNNVTKVLEEKVADYKRFAFILLALSVFMFIGLIVPNEGISHNQSLILVGLSVCSLVFALFFHKKAMKTQEQLYSEE